MVCFHSVLFLILYVTFTVPSSGVETEEQFVLTTSKNSLDNDDDDELLKKTEADPWNGNPPITCTSHGFYPDTNNNSLFFFCDLKKSGVGFTLRHMKCGLNRTFEAKFNACVLRGSTRHIRNGGKTKIPMRRPKEDKPQIMNAPIHSRFDCTKKKPGKYPDEKDCHIYHLCLRPDTFSPFEHLVVKCPHSTAYDSHSNTCSKKEKKFCSKEESLNIYCKEEIRFREIQSCDHYFLCYQDQVVEFLCPPGFQFDESLQFCEPERFVAC